MKDVVCLFHHDCFDGLGAAWAIFKRFPHGTFLPVDYRDKPPAGLEDKHVIVVDFSYEVDVMEEILAVADHVTFLDHHERAEEICATLNAANHPNLTCWYEPSMSGATMAWKHFHPDKRCPRILEHIEDRDLWRWTLPDSETILQGFGLYPLTLDSWDNVLAAVNHDDAKQEYEFLFHLQTMGEVIMTKNRIDINRIIGQTLRFVDFLGFEKIPLINVPRSIGSEALQQLANDHTFALGYYDDATHRVFSLRSKKGGQVVHTLAEKFGGGGHPHAAGFSVPRTHYAARM